MRAALLAMVALLAAAPGAHAAAPGDFDPAFAGDGLARFGPAPRELTEVAVQPDGRIVLAGNDFATGSDVVVWRLLPDGTPDPAFDGDGTARIDLGENDYVQAVALRPDGRIVLAGHSYGPSTDWDAWVLQLKAGGGAGAVNGALDPFFDHDGRLILDVGLYDFANALALRPDGKLWVGGQADGAPAIWRLKAEGAGDVGTGWDPSFSGNGLHTYDGDSHIEDLLALPAGGVVATNAEGVVWIEEGSGEPDDAYGEHGYVDLGDRMWIRDLALRPDGRILAAGNASSGGNGSRAAVAQLRADGGAGSADGPLDPGFGDAGIAALPPGTSGRAIALLGDGRAVVAGSRQEDHVDVGALAFRVGGDGAIDAAYGGTGTALDHAVYRDVAAGAGGDVLVAGDAWSAASDDRVGIAGRLLGEAPAPPDPASGTTEPSGDPDPGGSAAIPAALPPRAAITRRPRARTRKRRLRLAFTADQPATFECRLDRRRFEPCASPIRVRVRPGRHRFRVRAVNANGAGPAVTVRLRVLRR